MKKLIVAGFSLVAVGLLVLGSQTNVVGYQTQQEQKDVALQVEVSGSSSQRTVTLSQNEYQQLKMYLKDFQARLNASSSLDETKSLFKESLERFKNLGLLPSGTNIEALFARICRVLPRHVTPTTKMSGSGNVVNHLCLVNGAATFVRCQRLLFVLLDNGPGPGYLPSLLTSWLFTYFPFGIGQIVSLGGWTNFIPYLAPSIGYIHTTGVNGNYSTSGNLWGTLPLPWFDATFNFEICAPALRGFIGVKITEPSSGVCHFQGYALVASYSDKTPQRFSNPSIQSVG